VDAEKAQDSKTPQNKDKSSEETSVLLKEAKTQPEIQKTLAEVFGRHGVRLDVYLDDGKAVYNVEMQNLLQAFLPKRARYYHSEIDAGLLRRGAKYRELKPCYVIFICKFDPFGEGLYKYMFSSSCHEVEGLNLGDDAYTLFFSTVGTKESVDGTGKGEVSDKLKELLRYMNDTKSYSVESSDNELIKRIDAAVGVAKNDSEWRRAYMTYQARIWDAEDVGEARGEEKAKMEMARSLYADGVSIEKIVKYVKYPMEVIEKWLGLATV